MAWLTMSPCHLWQGLIVSRPIFPLTWRHAGPADGAPPTLRASPTHKIHFLYNF